MIVQRIRGPAPDDSMFDCNDDATCDNDEVQRPDAIAREASLKYSYSYVDESTAVRSGIGTRKGLTGSTGSRTLSPDRHPLSLPVISSRPPVRTNK